MHMSFTGERYVPELRGQIYYEHFHRYAMVLELARGKDVLDIACGEGYGTAALALVARTAIGVDLDPDSVRHASARYMAMNVGFRAGDCTQIPAGDASFDVAVSFETIEHLTEQERMLGELKRVLRPDGLLVISSPNKLVYSDGRSFQNPFHQRELYFHEFRDMLRSFFPKVRIFGQRVFAASAIHPLLGVADETRWLGPSTVAEGTLGALPDPEYFVAICGCDDGDELPDLCSVYLDPRDELLADIRSGGIIPALNGGQAVLDEPARAGVLTSGAQHADDETEPRLATLEAELGKAERELTARVLQVKSVEDHAGGLESLLAAEQRRTAELVASVQSLSDELQQEREAAKRVDGERRREDEALNARVAELEQASSAAHERRTSLERTIASQTGERERLEATVDQMRRKSAELLDERTRIERNAAGVTLERDSLRDALADQQRRQADELRALEDKLLTERGKVDFDLAAQREENRQLRSRAAELAATTAQQAAEFAAAARQQAAEQQELEVALNRARADLEGTKEVRRERERLIARLDLERLNYDELAQRAHQAETVLTEVLGSTSWRVTLPARRLMGALRGRDKR
jgi:ubiquinone/menaquinone biosynthesis C-methylase UbiE